MELAPCPSSPNCVSSQAEPSDTEHYMEPVGYTGSAVEALAAAAAVVEAAPGARVTSRTDDRLDAVFTTRIFRFKDDVTFVVDDRSKMLHFRSASRVGRSDLGANRKRMTALLPRIKERLQLPG
jgi:uncharacterized protein (DUF1499 family)